MGGPGERWTDLHSHVIPAVDDGAADPEQAAAAVHAVAAAGVDVVVATPHVDASLSLDGRALERRLSEVDRGWARLLEALPAGSGPRLERGVELRLDVPRPDLDDPRLRLGGGAAVLVEFAYFSVPPRSEHTLAGLREDGYLPVLAHPERYRGVTLAVARDWISAGAFLQINIGSLLGRYGKRPRQIALELLQRGWAHCLASDFHAVGSPGLEEGRRLLGHRGAAEQARVLFDENPSRLLRGEACRPIDPVEGGSRFMQWMEDLLRRRR